MKISSLPHIHLLWNLFLLLPLVASDEKPITVEGAQTSTKPGGKAAAPAPGMGRVPNTHSSSMGSPKTLEPSKETFAAQALAASYRNEELPMEERLVSLKALADLKTPEAAKELAELIVYAPDPKLRHRMTVSSISETYPTIPVIRKLGKPMAPYLLSRLRELATTIIGREEDVQMLCLTALRLQPCEELEEIMHNFPKDSNLPDTAVAEKEAIRYLRTFSAHFKK